MNNTVQLLLGGLRLTNESVEALSVEGCDFDINIGWGSNGGCACTTANQPNLAEVLAGLDSRDCHLLSVDLQDYLNMSLSDNV
jgi:hypothetical protein